MAVYCLRLAQGIEIPNIHLNGIPSWRDGLLTESASPCRIGRSCRASRIKIGKGGLTV